MPRDQWKDRRPHRDLEIDVAARGSYRADRNPKRTNARGKYVYLNDGRKVFLTWSQINQRYAQAFKRMTTNPTRRGVLCLDVAAGRDERSEDCCTTTVGHEAPNKSRRPSEASYEAQGGIQMTLF